MKINIICVGKLQSYFLNIFNEYKSKINFYAQLNIIELKEINEKNILIQKKKETKAILDSIPKNSLVWLCATTGPQYTSEEFSSFFDNDNTTFVIGGSNGVEEEHFERRINFSKMTFPHQLFRVILGEQIYRALAIKNNSQYHK